jgi:hypothetical protein
VSTKKPTAQQVDALIEAWNTLVAETKRGLPADPKKKKLRSTAGSLLRICPGRETFELRARILLAEKWRESAYTTLVTLYTAWDSLGAKARNQVDGITSRGPGQPPTSLERLMYQPVPTEDRARSAQILKQFLETH